MVKPDDWIKESMNWFAASFTGGCCGKCDEIIQEGDLIGYAADRQLVHRDCGADEIELESDGAGFDSFSRGRPPGIRVIPPGPRRAACPKCFMIHTAAQGDDCD